MSRCHSNVYNFCTSTEKKTRAERWSTSHDSAPITSEDKIKLKHEPVPHGGESSMFGKYQFQKSSLRLLQELNILINEQLT